MQVDHIGTPKKDIHGERERGRERITAIAQYFRRKQENGMKKHKETDVNFERGHS